MSYNSPDSNRRVFVNQVKQLKLALAQISTDAGNIEGNTKKIIKFIERAKAGGAQIVIFPELAIPGYMSLDLMLQEKLEKDLKKPY